MTKITCLTGLAQFRKSESGTVSTEAMILFPILLAVFSAGVVFFDAFRQQNLAQKANYVLGDMISQETSTIDEAYIASTYQLFELMTNRPQRNSAVRITVAEYRAEDDIWMTLWSSAHGTRQTPIEVGSVAFQDKLPRGADLEQIIVVETWGTHTPLVYVGLDAHVIYSYSFTSPRYAPQITYTAS